MTLGIQSAHTGDYLTEDTAICSYPMYHPRKRRCCHGNDGFTVISVCFFVLTVAITFALIIQIHYGSPEVTPHGAVATDAEECSHVGITIMKQGGSAVDVAIASLLCMTVVHPHVVGPGGSGVMLVHDHKSNKTVIIDFMSDVPESHRADLPVPDITDGRSIGIPGLMRGLQYAHSKFGKVPWASLFAPSVKFAREGFNVSAHLDKSYRKLDNTQVHGITPFEKTFYPRGVKLKAGDFIKREKYAEFLETIALNGGDSFYLLDFGAEEMRAITEAGADIHVREFENYEVRERSCIHMALRNNTLFTAPAPFGGPQLMLALKMLDSINSTQLYSDSVLYHSLVEAIRQSYAKFIKLAEEEEPNLQNITQQLLNVSDASVDTSITTDDPLLPQMPEQAATTVSVIDTFDQYVTAVAGLGTYFGSQVMTEHGILFNNHLANLPTPSSPEKGFSRARPLTPYTPVIITDVKKVCGQRVVLSSPEVGAVVQVVSQLLFRDEDLAQAIGKPRLHVKPGMMKVNVEALGNAPPLPGDVHNLLNATYGLHPLLEPYASVDGISKIKDKLLSWSDVRGGGVAHRLEPVSHLSSDGVGEV